MDIDDLKNPVLYINRELSLLEFNRRVIEQARDENLPLLERLKFLCIASTNLDEFFEIRVAGLKQQIKYGSVQTGADNLLPVEVMAKVSEAAHQLVEEQYDTWNNMIIPAMAKDKNPVAETFAMETDGIPLDSALLQRRSIADSESDRTRSGTSVSAGVEQKSVFYYFT